MRLKKIFLLLVFYPILNSGQDINIINQMFEKYNEVWYKNLTFKQETVYYKNDSITSKQIWHEAIVLPEGLIIKFESFDSGNGIIFKSDNQYTFRNNQLISEVEKLNELFILGFQVYFNKPEETIKKLQKLGYDLSKSYETLFNNKLVHIVGINDENEHSNYFIIDKENLLFIKFVKYSANGSFEASFEDYKKLGEAWIASKVVLKKNGKIIMIEKYYDIQTPKTIKRNLLDINLFRDAKW